MAQDSYKCEACGATFNSQADLDRHNDKEHGDNDSMEE
jgi:uncharacterized C2H2 Zn-finger protein